uniref:Uncharacterized protein n=1 Tax=Arundo donax TaxID=35708 RepID=A0A0A9DPP1_ARUDO
MPIDDSTAPAWIQYLSHPPPMMPAASTKYPFAHASGGASIAPVAAMSGSR